MGELARKVLVGLKEETSLTGETLYRKSSAKGDTTYQRSVEYLMG